jgi:hypothetical protein
MGLSQVIYSSQPFGFDEAILNGILLEARAANARDGITGALICRRDVYLQLLEGPEAAVAAIYEKITRDDRHLEVTLRAQGPVTERLFGDWDMLDDPARTWFWTRDEIAAGALDRATEDEIRAVFARVAGEVGGKGPA